MAKLSKFEVEFKVRTKFWSMEAEKVRGAALTKERRVSP